MQNEFPKQPDNFLKVSDFQDNEKLLTFKGWDYNPNTDYVVDGVVKQSWKDRIKYCLAYSYPEKAIDKTTGEPILDKKGNQMINSNYKKEYPHGYSISYYFEEGTLNSGSYPLWRAFCSLRPKQGDVIRIMKTGEGKETEWKVKKLIKAEDVEIQVDLKPDPLDSVHDERTPF